MKRLFLSFIEKQYLLLFFLSWALIIFFNFISEGVGVGSDIGLWLSYLDTLSKNPDLSLYRDIFEINFPGVLLFYYPMSWIHELWGVSYYLSVVFISFLTVSASLFVIYKIDKKDIWAPVLSVSIWVILNYVMLAQREFFVAILLLPYLWILVKENNGYTCEKNLIRMVSILFVVIAIWIKPLYVLIPLFSVAYLIYKTHIKNYLFDVFLATILLLIGGVITYETGYFEYVFPYLTDYHRAIFSFSVIGTFSYILAASLIYIIYLLKNKVFTFAGLASFIAILIQGKGFLYHLDILFLITVLALAYNGRQAVQRNPYDYYFSIFLVFVMFAFLVFAQVFSDRDTGQKEPLIMEELKSESCNSSAVLVSPKISMDLFMSAGISSLENPSAFMLLSMVDKETDLYSLSVDLVTPELTSKDCIVIQESMLTWIRKTLPFSMKMDHKSYTIDSLHYVILKKNQKKENG